MALNISSAQQLWDNKQYLVVYQEQNGGNAYPYFENFLAPSTSTTAGFTTYQSGRLLATYGTDAPDPALVGALVNWNPTSTVASQTKCTHILAGDWLSGISGVDVTSPETIAATLVKVSAYPIAIGAILYNIAITNANEPSVVTAFPAKFTIRQLSRIEVNGVSDFLISVQSAQLP